MPMNHVLVHKSSVRRNKWGGYTPLLEVVHKLTLGCMDVLRHHPALTSAKKIRQFRIDVLPNVLPAQPLKLIRHHFYLVNYNSPTVLVTIGYK